MYGGNHFGNMNRENMQVPKFLPMLRLLLSKAQERKDLLKTSKPCNVDIHL